MIFQNGRRYTYVSRRMGLRETILPEIGVAC